MIWSYLGVSGLIWAYMGVSGSIRFPLGLSRLIRPYLEYGAEIWNSETDCKWAEAEAIQRKMGKRILKVKSSCPDEAVMVELGWISLAGRRMMLRLFFWRKILMCGADRWVRRVYEASRRRAEAGGKSWCSLTRLWLRQLGSETQPNHRQKRFRLHWQTRTTMLPNAGAWSTRSRSQQTI